MPFSPSRLRPNNKGSEIAAAFVAQAAYDQVDRDVQLGMVEDPGVLRHPVAAADDDGRQLVDAVVSGTQACLLNRGDCILRVPGRLKGSGSNAMGIFHPYIDHHGVRLIGVEAAGEGLDSGKHAASIGRGQPGVLHGNRTYLLQNEQGQITETHSVSAGLDYPGVGPEHAYLHDIKRAEYVGITDAEALAAFHHLCRTEGIIPALESAHAVAYAMKLAPSMPSTASILVNLSGRGDKDIGTVADLSGADFYCRPSCQGQGVKGAGFAPVVMQP